MNFSFKVAEKGKKEYSLLLPRQDRENLKVCSNQFFHIAFLQLGCSAEASGLHDTCKVLYRRFKVSVDDQIIKAERLGTYPAWPRQDAFQCSGPCLPRER